MHFIATYWYIWLASMISFLLLFTSLLKRLDVDELLDSWTPVIYAILITISKVLLVLAIIIKIIQFIKS